MRRCRLGRGRGRVRGEGGIAGPTGVTGSVSNIAPILQAVASVAWAAFAFTALFVLRPAIINAMGRLSKAELFGQKIELREELEALQASASAATFEVGVGDMQVSAAAMQQFDEKEEKFDAAVTAILNQAKVAPKLALIALAAELEKQARQGLAVRGLLNDRRNVPIAKALGELGQYGFPPNLAGSVRLFMDVRNKIVHGETATDDDALSALDSGLTILRALDALPKETNIIHHPGVDIFSDKDCRIRIVDAKGVILETISAGGVIKSFRIFPTTRTHFKKGKAVAWEWNMQKIWGKAWYKDLESGVIKDAWDSSAEFVGRHLDEV